MQAIAQRRSRTVAAGRVSAGAPGSGIRFNSSRSGQSLIEACIVVAILCLVVFCGVQMSQIYMTSEVLNHAAVCGARARAVGFKDFMVQKTIRAAAIPCAGALRGGYVNVASSYDPYSITAQGPNHIGRAWDRAVRLIPGAGGDAQDQAYRTMLTAEKETIPLYLGSDYGQNVLDYERWPTITYSLIEGPYTVQAQIRQDMPLVFPVHRAFFAGDSILMQGDATIDNHYKLYLE
ncbi:MAG: hypothetical protein NTY53_01380 [Kiritimatiellaeota bacterium]|nr:hypothetical protein [Kiritimatiellota bacterium]